MLMLSSIAYDIYMRKSQQKRKKRNTKYVVNKNKRKNDRVQYKHNMCMCNVLWSIKNNSFEHFYCDLMCRKM